jgi:hypothetical protein
MSNPGIRNTILKFNHSGRVGRNNQQALRRMLNKPMRRNTASPINALQTTYTLRSYELHFTALNGEKS